MPQGPRRSTPTSQRSRPHQGHQINPGPSARGGRGRNCGPNSATASATGRPAQRPGHRPRPERRSDRRSETASCRWATA